MNTANLTVCALVAILPVAALAQSGSPGGTSGQVQYNQSGSFAGAQTLTYDPTANETTSRLLNKTRFLHAYATTGDGSPSNPWSMSASDWTSVFQNSGTIHAASGTYLLPSSSVVDLPSGTNLTCDPGAVFQWPSTLSPGATAMFHIPSGAVGVVVRNCEFEPGVSIPVSGEPGGGGAHYFQIGEIGATAQSSFQFDHNTFGPARFNDGLAGRQIHIESGTRDSTIANNRFNYAPRVIDLATGSASTTYLHQSLTIRDNSFAFDTAENAYQYAISIGYTDTPSSPAVFDTLVIHGNSFRNSHSAIYVGIGGRALSVVGNTINSNQADLILNANPISSQGTQQTIQQVDVVGNECSSGGYTGNDVNCGISVVFASDIVISGNSITAKEAAVGVNLSSRAIIGNNEINSVGNPVGNCIGVGNSNEVSIIGNVAIDCGYAIELDGVNQDVAIIGNTFAQSNYTVMVNGILGAATCTHCTATNNFTQGSDLSGGWADSPGSFAFAFANFGTVSPGTQPLPINATGMSVTNGTYKATISVNGSATQDTSFVLPPNAGSWGQQLTTDGVGTLSWDSRGFVTNDRPVDNFSDPNATSGTYTNASFVNDRDLTTFASRTVGSGGPWSEDWAFTTSATKTGMLEVWHRLLGNSCTSDPAHIPAQAIYYSTDGTTPAGTLLGMSAPIPSGGTTWTVSYVDLKDQDLSKLRVRAVYSPNGAHSGPGSCRADVELISFNEAPNTISFTSEPRTVSLTGHDGREVLVLKDSTDGSASSPDLVFRDNQPTPQAFNVRKAGSKLQVLNASGSEVLSVDQQGISRTNGNVVVRGTGSNSNGVVLWGLNGGTGNQVCNAMSLQCVYAIRIVSGVLDPCDQTESSAAFLALCK